MNEYPAQMTEYLDQVQKLVQLMNEKIKNMDVRSVSLGLLPALVKVSKLKPGFDSVTFGKKCFAYLWTIFVEEEDSSYKSDFCYNLQ